MPPLQSNKELAGVDTECSVAHLLEPDRNSISVHRFESQRFQDQHVESALDKVTGFVGQERTS